MIETQVAIEAAVAGLLASVACGLGALPLGFKRINLGKRIGLGYGFAAGLMVAASVYNLLWPALTLGNAELRLGSVLKTTAGLFLGCLLLWWMGRFLTTERLESRGIAKWLGGRTEALIFLTMCLHSVPEGIAVGVGYAGEARLEDAEGLGGYIALAISIHNIPEGLAVALPLRLRGVSLAKCFLFAFLTSLPQPIASVPACLLVWFFEPLILPCLGLAAGAMMYLTIEELVPDALETRSRGQVAWAFMIGFISMVLVQAVL